MLSAAGVRAVSSLLNLALARRVGASTLGLAAHDLDLVQGTILALARQSARNAADRFPPGAALDESHPQRGALAATALLPVLPALALCGGAAAAFAWAASGG